MAQFGPALAVDVFDEVTAAEYLVSVSGRTEDRDGATRLARALGLLPLALSHAGAYCAAGTSFADYLQLLGALPAAELFDSHPETSYAQTVASTWQVSIGAVERKAPLARQVLAMAAHLAPDRIPRELFDVLLEDTAASGRKRLLDAFNVLHRLSLAEVDDDTISVHRLLQKTIRDDARERGDVTAAESALAAVIAAFPSDHGQPQTWPQSEWLLPHTLAIEASFMAPGEVGEQVVRLLNGASEYLLRADKGARAVDVAMRASACAQRLLGGEHPAALRARAGLAFSYQDAGHSGEAIELGEPVLADCQRILGLEHPFTLLARENLSFSYVEAGRLGEAVELGERVLADCQRIVGPNHHYTLTAGLILGLAYAQAGRFGEAVQLEERVLVDCQRILGAEHPYTLAAGIALGFSYQGVGRSDEAIELVERVLVGCERILGSEHLYTLRARITVGLSYREAGRTTEAVALGEPVLADCERILGPEHPDTLHAGIVVGLAYQGAGHLDEAIELGQRVLAGCQRILGPEHPFTVRARANLTRFYQGAIRNAERIEQRTEPDRVPPDEGDM
jgi:tetratricopeptide (TPR) repeat protein